MATKKQPAISKTAAFRVKVGILEHLEFAKHYGGVSKTRIVEEALSKFLNEKYPLQSTGRSRRA